MKPAHLLLPLLAVAAQGAPPVPASPRALVLALDGLDWDVFRPLAAEGRMPRLSALVARGASGVIRAQPPLLSPAIWTTVATGVSPERHGIRDFYRGRERISSAERAAEALWETASASSRTVLLAGWLATWPAEDLPGGIVLSDQSLNRAVNSGRVSPPDALAGLPPLDLFETQPATETTRALRRFLGFDWDSEYARTLSSGSKEFARHDLAARRVVGPYRRDESFARAAEALMKRDRPRLALVHLWGADSAAHGFWRHSFGQASGAEKADFGRVIPEYYAYIDELAGRLMDAMGPGALVVAVSDHGFEAWMPPPGDPHGFLSGNHRPEGMLLLAGPGVRPGTLPDASAMDVAPTLLRYLDLAPPAGIEGRVLEDAFHPGALPPARPPKTAQRRARPRTPAALSREEEEGLRAMGYLR